MFVVDDVLWYCWLGLGFIMGVVDDDLSGIVIYV